MKKRISLLSLLITMTSFSQVGIGTNLPNSTLDVRGSLQTAFREINSDLQLGLNDYYITYNGLNDATLTLPVVASAPNSFNGRIYRIKNVTTKKVTIKASGSNTIRATNVPVTSFIIEPGCYAEIVNNTNTGASSATWDLSYIAQPYAPNVSLYGATLRIPPHNVIISDHNNSSYDSGTGTDRWWVVSNTPVGYELQSSTNAYIKPSKMSITYEYQGTPFDLTNLHPVLTVGNISSYPDVFTVSFGGFNTVSNKTRLTLTVSRVDFIGTQSGSNSNWQGADFFINALFTKKLY